jgi:hypothetical protein
MEYTGVPQGIYSVFQGNIQGVPQGICHTSGKSSLGSFTSIYPPPQKKKTYRKLTRGENDEKF